MKRYFYHLESILAIFFISLALGPASAQCTVNSSDNYSVTVAVQQVEAVLSKTSGCNDGSGYNYNIKYNYSVIFSGPNTPTITTMQGTFSCGMGNTLYFPLPTGGGSGQAITGENPFRNATDCATANLSSLGCNGPNFTLLVGGKGINTADPTAYNNLTTPCALLATAPLPVKLLSFDVRVVNDQAALTWTTASETNNAYFILERSQDAFSWSAITKIDGKGVSRINSTYTYTDELPLTGMSYYRLKQVDESGKATYSKVLGVEAMATGHDISIYPSPTKDDHLRVTGLQSPADWSIKISSTASAVVYQSTTVSQEVVMQGVPPGLYIVQLQNTKTGQQALLKLVKQ